MIKIRTNKIRIYEEVYLKQIIDELVKKENVRSNLSEARKRIKDAVCGRECTKQLLEYQE